MKFTRHDAAHLPKTLRRTIKRISTYAEVDKIMLGHAHNCRHRLTPGTIKVLAILPHGVRCKGYDDQGIREFFLKSRAPAMVADRLTKHDVSSQVFEAVHTNPT